MPPSQGTVHARALLPPEVGFSGRFHVDGAMEDEQLVSGYLDSASVSEVRPQRGVVSTPILLLAEGRALVCL